MADYGPHLLQNRTLVLIALHTAIHALLLCTTSGQRRPVNHFSSFIYIKIKRLYFFNKLLFQMLLLSSSFMFCACLLLFAQAALEISKGKTAMMDRIIATLVYPLQRFRNMHCVISESLACSYHRK